MGNSPRRTATLRRRRGTCPDAGNVPARCDLERDHRGVHRDSRERWGTDSHGIRWVRTRDDGEVTP